MKAHCPEQCLGHSQHSVNVHSYYSASSSWSRTIATDSFGGVHNRKAWGSDLKGRSKHGVRWTISRFLTIPIRCFESRVFETKLKGMFWTWTLGREGCSQKQWEFHKNSQNLIHIGAKYGLLFKPLMPLNCSTVIFSRQIFENPPSTLEVGNGEDGKEEALTEQVWTSCCVTDYAVCRRGLKVAGGTTSSLNYILLPY